MFDCDTINQAKQFLRDRVPVLESENKANWKYTYTLKEEGDSMTVVLEVSDAGFVVHRDSTTLQILNG